MALKQQITNIAGATTDYHRISEVHVDYTKRIANIIVLSYIGIAKRNEEKVQTSLSNQRDKITEELKELVVNPTAENEARRNELSAQLASLLQTLEDVAPRNILRASYEITLPADTNFSLELAYNWLKNNIYTEAEDC